MTKNIQIGHKLDGRKSQVENDDQDTRSCGQHTEHKGEDVMK